MPQRYQKQYHALGSDVFFTVVIEQDEQYAERLFERLYEQTIAFEKQFSRFLPDSELTKFNQVAGRKTDISPAFRKLLISAKRFAEQTDGLYNPFVLPALQRAGYQGSWPNTEAVRSGTNFSKRQVTTVEQLAIDKTTAQIPATAALDFGGIGKGYLLDELAQVLDREVLVGYWLSLGGDIICNGQDIDNQPWQIAIQKATESRQSSQAISNDGQKLAIATSGVTKRQGIKAGQPWHHIIDPRTGRSAQTEVLTATVTATTAVAADVYAKCLVIGGLTTARKYQTAGLIESFYLQTRDNDGTMQGRKA